MSDDPKAKHAANQRAHEQRRRAAGWKRLTLWVPPGCYDHAREALNALQESPEFTRAKAEDQ